MSEGMIALIGLLTLVSSSVLALSKKTHLAVPFIICPVVGGFLCGFSFKELGEFAANGVSASMNSILMCVFAVLYFAILSETGFFDIIVNKLVALTKGNVYVVFVVTVLVGFIGHLDGAYNTTFLIAIPALAPLYKKMGLDRRLLVLLVAMAAAPMTAMSWASPAKMFVYDPDINPVEMTQTMLPVIGIMLLLAVLFALYQGKKVTAARGEELRKLGADAAANSKLDWSDRPLAKPYMFIPNLILFFVSLYCFVFITSVKTYFLFMLFSAAAWLLNYHTGAEQNQIFRKNAFTMLAPGFLFMGIGVMVGILNGTGMVSAMVNIMLNFVPQSAARWTHVMWYVIILPLEVFVPYQAFQSVTPLLMGIGGACGLTSYQILNPALISYLNPASPLVAANNLAAELAEVDIMDLVKFSLPVCLLFNCVVQLLCVLLGIA